MTGDRSFSDLLQDIVRNLQEIVRSELRLAKIEIRDEAVRAKRPLLLLGFGTAAAMFAALFLLWTVVYAIALVLPSWASALIVGVTLAVIGGAAMMAGIGRFKQIPAPERTIETLKENVEWAKQQTK